MNSSNYSEWTGQIPSHWESKRLNYFVRLLTDKGENRENGIGLENIEGWTGRFIATDSDFNGEGVEFKNGDILFGKLRPYLAKVWFAEFAGEAVGDFHVMRPAADVFGRFVVYLMLNREFISIVDGSTFGAKMPRVSWDFMANLVLPCPPLDEQKAIVSFLDAETSKIDALVSEQRRLIELLKEKRQAVISHAVTKGLNPNAPMKPSGIPWLGDVPEHWQVNRVKYLTQILRGKFTHRPRNDPAMYDGPYPFIQTGEISLTNRYVGEHHQTLSEAGFKISKEFPSGTLVMTITGAGTANVALLNFRACFPDSIVGFVPCEGVSIDYLYHLFIAMREALLSTAVTNTQPNLNIERIGALLTVKPPIPEQRAIVDAIDRDSGNYNALIIKAERAIELLQERRTALISAAVTGKIDVRQHAFQEAT